MESTQEPGHTKALHSKHAGLEARLREELNRPAPDAATIQAIKKQKLRIKEELSTI
ncbi:MAG: YdcH family protein [Sphingomonadaceae bacterium]